MAAEKPSTKGQAWFCTTGLHSDVIIEVDDMTFLLHKFPLMSKSRKLHELIAEQENIQETKRIPTPFEHGQNSNNDIAENREIQEEHENEEEDDDQHCHINLPDFLLRCQNRSLLANVFIFYLFFKILKSTYFQFIIMQFPRQPLRWSHVFSVAG